MNEILDRGVDIDARAGSEGRTALHLVTQLRLPDAAAILLERGASVDATDDRGWTPLHVAAAPSAATGEPPDRSLVELLLARGADAAARTRDYWRTPLHLALASTLTDVITLVEPSSEHRPSDVETARSTDDGVVRPVDDRVACSTDGSVAGSTADTVARSTADDACATDDDARSTPRRLVAHLLLARGTPVDACDDRGWTALHHASTMYAPDHEVQMVELLLDHGAEKTIKTYDGRTALDHATATGLDDVARLLTARDATAPSTPSD